MQAPARRSGTSRGNLDEAWGGDHPGTFPAGQTSKMTQMDGAAHAPAGAASSLSLPEFLAEQVALVDLVLDRWVPDETVNPTSIHRAMRYSLFAGGKRIRPILAIA